MHTLTVNTVMTPYCNAETENAGLDIGRPTEKISQNILPARRYVSTVYATAAVCLTVCASVSMLCRKGLADRTALA